FQRRGGCTINNKIPFLSGADGVVSNITRAESSNPTKGAHLFFLLRNDKHVAGFTQIAGGGRDDRLLPYGDLRIRQKSSTNVVFPDKGDRLGRFFLFRFCFRRLELFIRCERRSHRWSWDCRWQPRRCLRYWHTRSLPADPLIDNLLDRRTSACRG